MDHELVRHKTFATAEDPKTWSYECWCGAKPEARVTEQEGNSWWINHWMESL